MYWKCAYITFSTSEEARACVAALNNTAVAGIKIKMHIVRPQAGKGVKAKVDKELKRGGHKGSD